MDPMDSVNGADDRTHLTAWVAITVALLATFLGVCKVKDDNIVQAMQQSQADKLDHWNFYQARNIREEVARTLVQKGRPLREIRLEHATLEEFFVQVTAQQAQKEIQ